MSDDVIKRADGDTVESTDGGDESGATLGIDRETELRQRPGTEEPTLEREQLDVDKPGMQDLDILGFDKPGGVGGGGTPGGGGADKLGGPAGASDLFNKALGSKPSLSTLGGTDSGKTQSSNPWDDMAGNVGGSKLPGDLRDPVGTLGGLDLDKSGGEESGGSSLPPGVEVVGGGGGGGADPLLATNPFTKLWNDLNYGGAGKDTGSGSQQGSGPPKLSEFTEETWKQNQEQKKNDGPPKLSVFDEKKYAEDREKQKQEDEKKLTTGEEDHGPDLEAAGEKVEAMLGSKITPSRDDDGGGPVEVQPGMGDQDDVILREGPQGGNVIDKQIADGIVDAKVWGDKTPTGPHGEDAPIGGPVAPGGGLTLNAMGTGDDAAEPAAAAAEVPAVEVPAAEVPAAPAVDAVEAPLAPVAPVEGLAPAADAFLAEAPVVVEPTVVAAEDAALPDPGLALAADQPIESMAMTGSGLAADLGAPALDVPEQEMEGPGLDGNPMLEG